MTPRRLLFLIAMALGLLLAGGPAARASETLSDPSGAFSFSAPEGWTVTEQGPGYLELRPEALPPGYGDTRIRVLKLGTARDAPDWVRLARGGFHEPGWKVLAIEKMPVHHTQGRRYEVVSEPAGTYLVHVEVERPDGSELHVAYRCEHPPGADPEELPLNPAFETVLRSLELH